LLLLRIHKLFLDKRERVASHRTFSKIVQQPCQRIKTNSLTATDVLIQTLLFNQNKAYAKHHTFLVPIAKTNLAYLTQVGHDGFDGVQHGGAQTDGAFRRPSSERVGVIDGVFKRHLEGEGQAIEALTHLKNKKKIRKYHHIVEPSIYTIIWARGV